MTDNELLLAISNMMDTKLGHITKDVQEMKEDIKEINPGLRLSNWLRKIKFCLN